MRKAYLKNTVVRSHIEKHAATLAEKHAGNWPSDASNYDLPGYMFSLWKVKYKPTSGFIAVFNSHTGNEIKR